MVGEAGSMHVERLAGGLLTYLGVIRVRHPVRRPAGRLRASGVVGEHRSITTKVPRPGVLVMKGPGTGRAEACHI
jgi:hypothetical protein